PDPPVEPDPPAAWATGRWSLRVDGQPLALDFDEARLELPAGMGVVAVTADVTADTAHLTFQTPYGAGVMRLVHASDRVTGSMTVAGQSAAVTGERAIVQPEPDVPEPPAPPAGDGTPFFEDTFDSGRTTSANGFRWTNSRYVDVVDGALRFRYGPIEPNGQTHMWAEQRFSLPRRMTEVWVEFYIRYSKNFVHEGTRNDKFFRIWGGDYNNQNKVGLCTWGRNGADPIIQFDRTKPEWSSGIGPSGGPSATWPISRMKDGWHRVRMHY